MTASRTPLADEVYHARLAEPGVSPPIKAPKFYWFRLIHTIWLVAISIIMLASLALIWLPWFVTVISGNSFWTWFLSQ